MVNWEIIKKHKIENCLYHYSVNIHYFNIVVCFLIQTHKRCMYIHMHVCIYLHLELCLFLLLVIPPVALRIVSLLLLSSQGLLFSVSSSGCLCCCLLVSQFCCHPVEFVSLCPYFFPSGAHPWLASL